MRYQAVHNDAMKSLGMRRDSIWIDGWYDNHNIPHLFGIAAVSAHYTHDCATAGFGFFQTIYYIGTHIFFQIAKDLYKI